MPNWTIARMEPFARFVVAGGLALVAGLWLLEFAATWTLPWGLGAVLVALGVGGLSAGIWTEIEP